MKKLKVPSKKIKSFCQKYHIRKLSIFGSALRDDFNESSDIDILVEFESSHTPGLRFFTMQEELSAIFGRKVDLHTPQFLSRYFREQVMAEARIEYAGS